MASSLVVPSTSLGARLAPRCGSVRPKAILPCGAPRVPSTATIFPLREPCRKSGTSSASAPACLIACKASNRSLDDYEFDDFFSETQRALSRVLTARAVQKVLTRLHRRSTPTFEWLSAFTKVVPPIGGDEFLLQLMKSQAVTKTDSVTKLSTTIHPAALAQEVLAVREDMSATAAQGLPDFVKSANLDVLKRHLEQSHYTLSVTNQKLDKKRKDEKLGKRSEKSSA